MFLLQLQSIKLPLDNCDFRLHALPYCGRRVSHVNQVTLRQLHRVLNGTRIALEGDVCFAAFYQLLIGENGFFYFRLHFV